MKHKKKRKHSGLVDKGWFNRCLSQDIERKIEKGELHWIENDPVENWLRRNIAFHQSQKREEKNKGDAQ